MWPKVSIFLILASSMRLKSVVDNASHRLTSLFILNGETVLFTKMYILRLISLLKSVHNVIKNTKTNENRTFTVHPNIYDIVTKLVHITL